MRSFTSFILLAILLGCNAIDYRYKHGLKAGGCPPALLAECKENWDPASCALCGNGGLGLFPRPFGIPFGGGVGGLFPFQPPLFLGGGGGGANTIFIQEQQPDGTIILRPAPSPGTNIITLPPNPPNCPRIINCGVNQFFDERDCRCRCIQQIQCSACEEPNPLTCACAPRVTCPAPLVLDNNCQCSCGNSQFFRCNRLQRLNPQTCQCECSLYIATIQVRTPGRIVPPSIAPGLPEVRTRTTRTPGTRSTTRRTGKRSINDEMEGPELDNVPLLREKRRRSRSRSPGTRSTETRTSTVVVGTPTIIEGFQEPDTVTTETRQVSVCPVNTFQNDVTCTCN